MNIRLLLYSFRTPYTWINVTGLIASLTVFLLTFLWVQDEQSYDRFHPGYRDLYRVVQDQYTDSLTVYPMALTPAPLAPYLVSTFPEILTTARVAFDEFFMLHEDRGFYNKGVTTDSTFFSMFGFEIAQGRPFGSNWQEIVLSPAMAKRYFGEENPVGKSLKIGPFFIEVVGLLKEPRGKSHFAPDFILPFELRRQAGFDDFTNWHWSNYHTYARISPRADTALLFAKTSDALIKNRGNDAKDKVRWQPLADIHLKSGHLNNDILTHGSSTLVRVLWLTALLVLAIACINYTNLSTAQSLRRSKEVGVRKVMGASRVHLALRAMAEVGVQCVLATLVALFFTWLCLPSFNSFSGKPLTIDVSSAPFWWALVTLVATITFVGGAYPAWLLSSYHPVAALKGKFVSGRLATWLRRGLVMIQFVIAMALIAATWVVHTQLHYLATRHPGIERENVLVSFMHNAVRKHWADYKAELQKLPGVLHVTATQEKVSFTDATTTYMDWEGKKENQEISFHYFMTDYDFVPTFGVTLLEGRGFDPTIASDSNAVLLNEAAVRQMGITDPVNKPFTIRKTRKGRIIGIVKDFNFKSAHRHVEPMVIYLDPPNLNYVAIRFTGSPSEIVERTRAVFRKFSTERPYDYSFLSDDMTKLHETEQKLGRLLLVLGGLAIFVSCLGLLGMILFATSQRMREVAIRKAMGASVPQLTWMLSAEFVGLILVAFVIMAVPVYHVTQQWLSTFAYRTDQTVPALLLAGGLSLAVGWLTVLFKAVQVAMTDPVKVLKSE